MPPVPLPGTAAATGSPAPDGVPAALQRVASTQATRDHNIRSAGYNAAATLAAGRVGNPDNEAAITLAGTMTDAGDAVGSGQASRGTFAQMVLGVGTFLARGNPALSSLLTAAGAAVPAFESLTPATAAQAGLGLLSVAANVTGNPRASAALGIASSGPPILEAHFAHQNAQAVLAEAASTSSDPTMQVAAAQWPEASAETDRVARDGGTDPDEHMGEMAQQYVQISRTLSRVTEDVTDAERARRGSVDAGSAPPSPPSAPEVPSDPPAAGGPEATDAAAQEGDGGIADRLKDISA